MEAIQGYTLGQFHAFSLAASRHERERLRDGMAILRIAVNGDAKSYEKMAKTLGG